MLNLYLIRHAETQTKLPWQKDYDRALTNKGTTDAEKLGAYLHQQKISFDLISHSSAIRTTSTAQLLSSSILLSNEKVVAEQIIYHATASSLFDFVTCLQDACLCVGLVGHNPAISHLAVDLAQERVAPFNPCTMVHLRFDVKKWIHVQPKTGQLISVWNP